MQGFISATGIGEFRNIYDPDFVVWDEFDVRNQPTFVFVAADGTRTKVGAMNEDASAEKIGELF